MLVGLSAAVAANLDTFRPAPGAWCGEGVQVSGAGPARGEVCAGLYATYAEDPLVQRWGTDSEPILATVAATRLGAAWSPLDRLVVALDAPIYPYVGRPESGIQGGAMGDLRAEARLAWGTTAWAWHVRQGVGLPTGSVESYTGAGGVSGLLLVGTTLRRDRLALVGEAGVDVLPYSDVEGTRWGSAASYGLAGRWAATARTTVGVEVDAAVPLLEALDLTATPTEIHVYGQWRADKGLRATVGAGTGILGGVGAPDLRLFAGLSWEGQPAPWASPR